MSLTARKVGGMSDRTVTCRDCGQEFIFTEGEQSFYLERGYTEPQRCPSCRYARKAQRNNEGGYNSGGYGGGGGYSSGPREMHSAVCSSCGKEAQVRFRPTARKPDSRAHCLA